MTEWESADQRARQEQIIAESQAVRRLSEEQRARDNVKGVLEEDEKKKQRERALNAASDALCRAIEFDPVYAEQVLLAELERISKQLMGLPIPGTDAYAQLALSWKRVITAIAQAHPEYQEILIKKGLSEKEREIYAGLPAMEDVVAKGDSSIASLTRFLEMIGNRESDQAKRAKEGLAQVKENLTKAREMPPPAAYGAYGCFIATAAFGSPLEPEVRRFRDWRDEYLLHRGWGRVTVRAYYRFGPLFATWISAAHWRRAVARKILRGVLFSLVSRPEKEKGPCFS